MDIEIYGKSEIGNREYNEDSISYEQLENDAVIAMVADGLGGCGGGEIASGLVKEQFLQMQPETCEAMCEFYDEANKIVLEKQKHSVKMKSTAVSLVLKDNTIITGHIGDSRLYHFYNGKLIFKTMDHSVTQLAVLSGEIEESQMGQHEDRNKLLRAIGTSQQIKPVIEEPKSLAEGVHFFLLCTDGFWEYITDQEMIKKVNRHISAKKWLDKLFHVWKKKAQNADNSSAIAIKCVIKK